MSKSNKSGRCAPSWYALGAIIVSTTLAATTSKAVLIDTFTRADGTDIGATEVGGLVYTERGNSNISVPNGTADILNNQLRITGKSGSLQGDTGGVYVNPFNAPDVSVSVQVGFAHSIAAPVIGGTAPEELRNTFLLLLRSQPVVTFGNSAANRGLVGIEVGPNGDLLVRELQGATGTLTTVNNSTFANPFRKAGVNRQRLTPGTIPATYGDLPLDTDQDGFIDDGESFLFTANLRGTALSLFINNVQVGSYNLAEASGLNNVNGIGFHENLISSAFETRSDIYLDNLDVTALPEPTSAAALAGVGALALTRRRTR